DRPETFSEGRFEYKRLGHIGALTPLCAGLLKQTIEAAPVRQCAPLAAAPVVLTQFGPYDGSQRAPESSADISGKIDVAFRLQLDPSFVPPDAVQQTDGRRRVGHARFQHVEIFYAIVRPSCS